VSQTRTVWDEGRRPGRQVVSLSALTAAATAALNLALTGELSLFFDCVFVVVCVVAAFAVRPRDFFVVGVLPPLLMLGTVLLLAVVARSAVADPVDSLVQAVVSGLAHHAGGLVAGYALALGVLALRQVAAKNSGRLRTFA
jgi:ATP/ADP translocase